MKPGPSTSPSLVNWADEHGHKLEKVKEIERLRRRHFLVQSSEIFKDNFVAASKERDLLDLDAGDGGGDDEGEDELAELRLKIKQALLNAHINMETNRRISGEISSGRLSGSSSMEFSADGEAMSVASSLGDSRRLSFER